MLSLALALLLGAAAIGTASAGTTAWVDTGGDCLRLRDAPGLSAGDLACLDHGTEVILLGPQAQQDGFTWLQVQWGAYTGWVAGFYITTDPAEVQTIRSAARAPGVLEVPPEGGLTIGRAGTDDLAALVAAQSFAVAGVWHLDIPSQRMFQYLPTAPAFVNSLASVGPDDIVMVRRAGVLASPAAVADPSLTVAGTPNLLPTPPVGGLTQGVAGTTDPRFLAQAQEFTVESIWYLDVASQRWLGYVPGAPDFVQTLKQGQLTMDSVVTVRRGPDAPRPPSSADSTYFETSITYYYCVPGQDARSWGDGGGYCGTMANGEQVHDGAAACSPGLLGQRFTIDGDPTGRTYECTDTGGSVLQDHRDIWFMTSDAGYAWWLAVGPRAFIRIVP